MSIQGNPYGSGSDMGIISEALGGLLGNIGEWFAPANAGKVRDMMDMSKWRNPDRPGETLPGTPWPLLLMNLFQGDKQWVAPSQSGVGLDYASSPYEPSPRFNPIPGGAAGGYEQLYASEMAPKQDPQEIMRAMIQMLMSGGTPGVPGSPASGGGLNQGAMSSAAYMPGRFHEGGAINDLRRMMSLDRGEVPAVLEKGEVVVNKNAANAIGPDNIDMLNQMFPRYHPGGEVTMGEMSPLDATLYRQNLPSIMKGYSSIPLKAGPSKKEPPFVPGPNLAEKDFYVNKASHPQEMERWPDYEAYVLDQMGPEWMISNKSPKKFSEALDSSSALPPGLGTAMEKAGLTGWSPVAKMYGWTGGGKIKPASPGLSPKYFFYKDLEGQGYQPEDTVWVDKKAMDLPNLMLQLKGLHVITDKKGNPITQKMPNGRQAVLFGARAGQEVPNTIKDSKPQEAPAAKPAVRGQVPINPNQRQAAPQPYPPSYPGPTVEGGPPKGGVMGAYPGMDMQGQAMSQAIPQLTGRTSESQMPIDEQLLGRMDTPTAMEYLRRVAMTQAVRPSSATDQGIMSPNEQLYNQLLERFGKGASIDNSRAEAELRRAETVHQKIASNFESFTAPQRAALVQEELNRASMDNWYLRYLYNHKAYLDKDLQKLLLEAAESEAKRKLYNAQAGFYLRRNAGAGSSNLDSQKIKLINAGIGLLKDQAARSEKLAMSGKFNDQTTYRKYITDALVVEFVSNPAALSRDSKSIMEDYQKKSLFGKKYYVTEADVNNAKNEAVSNPAYQLLLGMGTGGIVPPNPTESMTDQAPPGE